ncbi:MAG: hypothetical protein JWQ28_1397 [Pedobacter sp.]|nr:hypothetical protein [Pedobacter sp.]
MACLTTFGSKDKFYFRVKSQLIGTIPPKTKKRPVMERSFAENLSITHFRRAVLRTILIVQ